jgi:hypothetical protein
MKGKHCSQHSCPRFTSTQLHVEPRISRFTVLVFVFIALVYQKARMSPYSFYGFGMYRYKVKSHVYWRLGRIFRAQSNQFNLCSFDGIDREPLIPVNHDSQVFFLPRFIRRPASEFEAAE